MLSYRELYRLVDRNAGQGDAGGAGRGVESDFRPVPNCMCLGRADTSRFSCAGLPGEIIQQRVTFNLRRSPHEHPPKLPCFTPALAAPISLLLRILSPDLAEKLL